MRSILSSRNISITLRTRLLQCYIWPIVLYECEAWTIKEDLRKRIEAFEMWTYRRMLSISWTQRRYDILQLIMMGQIAGKRGVGRGKKSWLRNIRQWTGVTSAAKLFHLARERDKYSALMSNLQ
ncbi:hypothetical protein ACJJTC_001682 [Scirpophaga incertulas]